jgi:CO dehydrogenase/acetyl-CoA synthase alpha subunit
MEGSVPGNDNDTVDTTKNKYHRYIDLNQKYKQESQNLFQFQMKEKKVSRLPSSTKMDSIMLYLIHVYTKY